MKPILRPLFAVAFVALVASPVLAAEPADKASGDRLAAELKEPFARLGEIVTLVAKGEVEDAYAKFAENVADIPKEKGEFESDHHTSFRRLFKQFPKGVESLDLVTVQRISTRSYRLSCVANTRRGPVIVEAITYRHGNAWWFCQIGYQPVDVMNAERLKVYSETFPAAALTTPVSIPINSEPSNKVSSIEK